MLSSLYRGERRRRGNIAVYGTSAIGFGPEWTITAPFAVTQNFAAGPSGFVNATRIVCPNGAGAVVAKLVGKFVPSTNYAASWWVKNNAGANNPFMKINGGPADSPGLVASQNYVAGGSWAKVSFSFATVASGSGSTEVWIYVTSDQNVGSADILVADMLVVNT